MPTPTVFLFDIDGTLIDGAGAGRRAMEHAFVDVVGGKRAAIANVRFAGSTDPAIVRSGLRAAGVPDDDGQVERILRRYLERLPQEIASVGGAYRLHAGVETAVAAAEAQPDAAVGLGTGNLAGGARLKLEPVAIWSRFAFGGFGSDAEARDEVLATGARRGAARLGVAPEACRVLVIGDTPRDVAAAQAIGADCLAVATGLYGAEALAAAGATWVVERLDAPDALRAIALGEGS